MSFFYVVRLKNPGYILDVRIKLLTMFGDGPITGPSFYPGGRSYGIVSGNRQRSENIGRHIIRHRKEGNAGFECGLSICILGKLPRIMDTYILRSIIADEDNNQDMHRHQRRRYHHPGFGCGSVLRNHDSDKGPGLLQNRHPSLPVGGDGLSLCENGHGNSDNRQSCPYMGAVTWLLEMCLVVVVVVLYHQ